jgi:hypothetical protein
MTRMRMLWLAYGTITVATLAVLGQQPPTLITSGNVPTVTASTTPTTDPAPVNVGDMVMVRFTTPTNWGNSRSAETDPALGYPPISADVVGYYVAGTKEWVCIGRCKTIWEGRGVYSDLYTIPRSSVATAMYLKGDTQVSLPVTRP